MRGIISIQDSRVINTDILNWFEHWFVTSSYLSGLHDHFNRRKKFSNGRKSKKEAFKMGKRLAGKKASI